MTEVSEADRAAVLQSFGARGGVLGELLAYTRPVSPPAAAPVLPLPDEPHLDVWTDYEREARKDGVMTALRRHLVQLRFPIQAGVSATESYRRATRKGDLDAAPDGPGQALADAASVRLSIQRTIAGRIPVLLARDREDFVALVRAFTERNEPAEVLPSMGACIVNGLNNWHRVALARQAWIGAHPVEGDAGWLAQFPRFAEQKPLYQDRFIILSSGPYSAVAAADMGVPPEGWLDQSVAIRLAHECTHYFTLRVFGSMRSHVLDELVADFVGLVQGLGSYSAARAATVLGLVRGGALTPGGRIALYCGSLSSEATRVLGALTWAAIEALESLAERRAASLSDVAALAHLTYELSCLSLADLASPALHARLSRESP